MIDRMIRWSATVFALLAAALVLVSCTDAEPTVDERFVDAFVDMRVVEQIYGAESPMARVGRRSVLQKYGYTRESFLEMSQKIQDDAHYWMPFQKRVVNRVESILDPESFLKKKEEEAAKEAAKKAKKKEEKK